MYNTNKIQKSQLKINQTLEGETLEQKINRITVNKEPIKDGAPLLYTERNEGVKAGYNIKTDRFEVALDAMTFVEKSISAKRDNKPKMQIVKDDKIETIQGTENGTN